MTSFQKCVGGILLKVILKVTLQFSSVPFKMVYLSTKKIPYVLHPVSQMFPQCYLCNKSNVCLIGDGPLSSFQVGSSSTSSFHAPLL